MAAITYDVRIWKSEIYHGSRVTTYKVRWTVGGRAWKQPFRTKAQAASFEAELRSAAARGEAFDVSTGRPVSWAAKADGTVTWFDFCVSYVDMKWKASSAHHRANIAWALITVMPAMLANNRGPDGLAMRTALRQWGFNSKRRADSPEEASDIHSWLSLNTKPVAALTEPANARALFEAAATLLDGRRAAPSTVRRNRTILHNALEYAVERSCSAVTR
jgi:hypothetical protein